MCCSYNGDSVNSSNNQNINNDTPYIIISDEDNKKKRMYNKALLYFVYGFFIIIGVFAFYMYRINKYEFYLKNNEILVGNGSSYQIELTPKISENFYYLNYIYEIVNDDIASVDEFGCVTGKSIGTTELKIKYKHGFSYKTMKVNVENIDVNEINIDSNIELLTSESIKINPKINNNDNLKINVEYESDNPNIVKIDEYGNLTAISSGETTITVKSKNGTSEKVHVVVNNNNKEVEKISLNETNISLKKNSKSSLIPIITPINAVNQNLKWVSDNNNVSVDTKGNIVANKVGKSIITVSSSNGKTASCTINVIDTTVEVKSLSLNASSKEMTIYQTDQLYATINPSNATIRNITWTSSNSNVVSVNNGKITAKKVGKATITAKSNNGKKATCVVNVKNVTVAISSIKLNISSTTLNAGDHINLVASISPSDATNKEILWSSNNSSIASVTNGMVTAKAKGTAVITAKTVNGKTATCTIIVRGESFDNSINSQNNNTINVPTNNTNNIPNNDQAHNNISRIHFIHTGSSDCILIESNGLYGLVDAAEGYNDGTAWPAKDAINSVEHAKNYLNSLGVKSLSFVVATHSHSDHIGGMKVIADNFVNSETVYYYRPYEKTLEDSADWDNIGYYNRAINAMKAKGAQLKNVTNIPATIEMGDFKIQLLNTEVASNSEKQNGVVIGENKNSIVEYITYKGKYKTLLTADMEMEDEMKVANITGSVEILKIGHHSYPSATSMEFALATNPKNIIITNNGLDDRETSAIISFLQSRRGAKIYIVGYAQDAVVVNYNDSGYSISPSSAIYGSVSVTEKKGNWEKVLGKHWIYYKNNVPLYNEWEEIDNHWYYFNNKGIMLTGWQKLIWTGGYDWFYFDSNGRMLTGWQKLEWEGKTNWYYFDSNGVMLANKCSTIEGKNYCFNSSGECYSGNGC